MNREIEIRQFVETALDNHLKNNPTDLEFNTLSRLQIKYLLFNSYFLYENIYHGYFDKITQWLADTSVNESFILEDIKGIIANNYEKVTSTLALQLRYFFSKNEDLQNDLSLRLHQQYYGKIKSPYYTDEIDTRGLEKFTEYYLFNYDGYLYGDGLINLLGVEAEFNLYEYPELMKSYQDGIGLLLSEKEKNNALSFYKSTILQGVLEELEY